MLEKWRSSGDLGKIKPRTGWGQCMLPWSPEACLPSTHWDPDIPRAWQFQGSVYQFNTSSSIPVSAYVQGMCVCWEWCESPGLGMWQEEFLGLTSFLTLTHFHPLGEFHEVLLLPNSFDSLYPVACIQSGICLFRELKYLCEKKARQVPRLLGKPGLRRLMCL